MTLTPRKKRLLAVAFVILGGLSLINASWLAPTPVGGPKLVAHRGVSHLYDKTGLGRDDCTATRIRTPEHDIFENTTKSMKMAAGLGANIVEVDIAPTKDNRMVLFHDWTIDCRTNGKGETRDHTLAELQALDIGFGYSADGGKTFPLRGKGVGMMPTMEQALAELQSRAILFNFKSNDAAEADQLAAIIKASGRDAAKLGDGFYGAQAPVDRIRKLMPGTWAFSKDEAKACTKAYVATGWTGIVPGTCKDAALFIPLNYQWTMWGWPNRLISRMESVGAKVIVFGPFDKDDATGGLTEPGQLGDIPSSFNGYIWVEDIWAVGPALKR